MTNVTNAKLGRSLLRDIQKLTASEIACAMYNIILLASPFMDACIVLKLQRCKLKLFTGETLYMM